MRAIALATTLCLASLTSCGQTPTLAKSMPTKPRAVATKNPRAILVLSEATGRAIGARLTINGGGLVRINQHVSPLEVACPPTGKDVYGRVDLPAAEWLELNRLTPAELDENLEYADAISAQPLRVTHRVTARVPHPPKGIWSDKCLTATHYIANADLDTVNGKTVARRVVLMPLFDEIASGSVDCRLGFHLASSHPGLCVQREPYTCDYGQLQDCKNQCEAGDAGSCEHLVTANIAAPARALAAERACSLSARNCCGLAATLANTAGSTAKAGDLAQAGCQSGQSWCCSTLSSIRFNAGDLAGSAQALAAGCNAGLGTCLAGARRSRAAGLLDLARDLASVACQAEAPDACAELRSIAKQMPGPQP